MEDTKQNKSRHLSISELFLLMQEEYIVCELRSKIYPKCHVTKDSKEIDLQKYWLDLMLKKKEKIKDLAIKNKAISIFDHPSVMNDFKNKIYKEWGFPRFIYKDDFQKLQQEKWDIHNYYADKAVVKVMDNESRELRGTIEGRVDLANQKIKIRIVTDEVKEFDLETVTRVL